MRAQFVPAFEIVFAPTYATRLRNTLRSFTAAVDSCARVHGAYKKLRAILSWESM